MRTLCAVASNRTAACWCQNEFGQIGNGPQNNRSLPAIVKNTAGNGSLNDITELAAAGGGTCGVLTDTSGVCWVLADESESSLPVVVVTSS